ncbi:GNAT family N-acetyltransferase [Roseibium salinum]|nr:GNAT family N-acetyltransferase [Roseibium salinum]
MATFREHWRISEATIRSLQMTVAERGGRPIGFSGLSAEGEDTLLIDFLFVAPEAQRQGVGNLLLSRAEDYARSKKIARVFIWNPIVMQARSTSSAASAG